MFTLIKVNVYILINLVFKRKHVFILAFTVEGWGTHYNHSNNYKWLSQVVKGKAFSEIHKFYLIKHSEGFINSAF